MCMPVCMRVWGVYDLWDWRRTTLWVNYILETCGCACARTHTQIQTHARTHTHTHVCTRTNVHTNTQTNPHTGNSRKQIHTYIHTYTYAPRRPQTTLWRSRDRQSLLYQQVDCECGSAWTNQWQVFTHLDWAYLERRMKQRGRRCILRGADHKERESMVKSRGSECTSVPSWQRGAEKMARGTKIWRDTST